jgi:hypothetical protein
VLIEIEFPKVVECTTERQTQLCNRDNNTARLITAMQTMRTMRISHPMTVFCDMSVTFFDL